MGIDFGTIFMKYCIQPFQNIFVKFRSVSCYILVIIYCGSATSRSIFQCYPTCASQQEHKFPFFHHSQKGKQGELVEGGEGAMIHCKTKQSFLWEPLFAQALLVSFNPYLCTRLNCVSHFNSRFNLIIFCCHMASGHLNGSTGSSQTLQCSTNLFDSRSSENYFNFKQRHLQRSERLYLGLCNWLRHFIHVVFVFTRHLLQTNLSFLHCKL